MATATQSTSKEATAESNFQHHLKLAMMAVLGIPPHRVRQQQDVVAHGALACACFASTDRAPALQAVQQLIDALPQKPQPNGLWHGVHRKKGFWEVIRRLPDSDALDAYLVWFPNRLTKRIHAAIRAHLIDVHHFEPTLVDEKLTRFVIAPNREKGSRRNKDPRKLNYMFP